MICPFLSLYVKFQSTIVKSVSFLLDAINQLTENDITQFRNTAFDNAAVELLTTGHRRSFEFLDQIVLKDQNKFEGNLINDLEGLSILKDYFVLAEDYLRDGRLNKVSMAYVEAARYPHFADLYWLQELILDKALEAASKYKADGGKQLAFCQILLSEMLESMKVRKLRQKNMIWGKDYMTSVPKKCHEILESCLEKSTGRSHWALPDPNNQKQIPFELISAGHLARLKLADNISDESNLKRAIKLSEQANCQWLISLSNYYLAKFLVDHDRKLEAVVRLEKGLNIINKQNQDSEILDLRWGINYFSIIISICFVITKASMSYYKTLQSKLVSLYLHDAIYVKIWQRFVN